MDLPDFEIAFGAEAYRLKGIDSWQQVPLLGRENIERLLHRVRTTAIQQMAESSNSDDLKAIRRAIAFLDALLPDSLSKPLLPRLRVESFRKGDAVQIFVGDSEDVVAPTAWVPAIITDVEKAYRPDWNDGSANGGYHWRWTATTTFPIFPQQSFVRFSTSEPRVLTRKDRDYLYQAGKTDPSFRSIFVQNAWRSWEPLWCLERGIHSSGAGMDMEKWLSAVTA